MKRWLLLDCDYLCHRAWYAMGTLSHGDVFTGVIYGFLKDIIDFKDRFLPSAMVFCFDSRKSLRQEMLPGYKSNRRKTSEEDQELYVHFNSQRVSLRKDILRNLGFQNIFFQKGYEADDGIASIIENFGHHRDIHHVIISRDHDLYQLLGPRVSMFNPHGKSITTEEVFIEEWKVSPSQWIDVKSIAGCKTDCIPGIPGVGEKTAAKYIAGELPATSKKFQDITKGVEIWKRNYPLVKLPLPGLQCIQVRENEKIDKKMWLSITDELGMESIKEPPF